MIPKQFDYVVGTGGIGKGVLFKFQNEYTLGRNETRLAELTDFKDYCKLHIVLHYVAAFTERIVPVYAIGSVGRDDVGQELLALMGSHGISTEHIHIDEHSKTLYAVCFQYPSGDGGNITASNSASNRISEEQVSCFFKKQKSTKGGIVLSVPEAPVATRVFLLHKGRENGCYNAASLLGSEVEQFVALNAFSMIDLLAVNQEEAQTIADQFPALDGESDMDRCFRFLKAHNSEMSLVITCGKNGAYIYSGNQKQFIPTVDNTVVNTAGAGDCFLGTAIAALIHRIPLIQSSQDYIISSAVQLASLSSSLKVACNDTIDFSINKKTLWEFIKNNRMAISDNVRQRFFGLRQISTAEDS